MRKRTKHLAKDFSEVALWYISLGEQHTLVTWAYLLTQYPSQWLTDIITVLVVHKHQKNCLIVC